MPELWLLQPELSWIRNLLVDHIVWGRYDFSREPKHFRDADRDLYIDELTRPLKPEDDLRFVFEDQHGSVYIFAERLTWDSEFFRYQVARLNAIFPSALLPYTSTVDFTGALAALVAEAAKRGIRYLLTSVFPEDLALVQGLSRTGFALIETRMLHHMPLANYSYSHRYPVRFAQSQDIDILKQTAREAINAYDRFHADSFIVPSEADRLVEEWVTASIERGFANVTLIPNIEHPQAFTTVRYNRECWSSWGYKVAQTVLLQSLSKNDFANENISAASFTVPTIITNAPLPRCATTLFTCWPVENCTSLIEPPAQKSVHIDFETPITGIGWRATEIYNVTGSYFRWSVSSRCELYTRLQAGHNYSLRLRLVEAISPEVLDSLQMKINDYSIALERVDDDPAFIVLQGRIPSEAIPSDETLSWTLRIKPHNTISR